MPTFVKQDAADLRGEQVIKPETSAQMRDLLRYVVTNGSGKRADVAGYDVGGKTGSAQVPGPHGRYIPHALRTSFYGVFPVHNPRYVVYILLDQPHGTKATAGFALAGWTAAPAVAPGDPAHCAAAGRAQYRAAHQACIGRPVMSPQSGGHRLAGMQFSGLTSDSRKVQPGFLFAALAGSKTDGARFVNDAVARGATAVLGAPDLEGEVAALDVTFIADANPRLRLAKLAAEFYHAQPDHVAAVTGTKGKSSIVAFMREIWTRLGIPAARWAPSA